ncbi:MAG: DUF4179 domain-containing protein [Peptostreptococcaceae bacterium]
MKNKYEIFNDTYIDEDRYTDVVLSDEEKENMKKRMSSKINNKSNYKKKIAVSVVPILIAGGVIMSSETTWAYIEKVGKQIEDFLGRGTEEFKGYKVAVNQTVEDKGVKIHLNEIMLDDGQLILSVDMDVSELNDTNLNIKEDSLMVDIPDIIINDKVYAGLGGTIDSGEYNGGDEYSFLIAAKLTDIDTDGDGLADTPYEILDNIEENKDYDIKIVFDSLQYETYSEEGNIVGGGAVVDVKDNVETEAKESFNIGEINGNWEFNATVNGANIMSNTEVHKLDKEIEINTPSTKGTLTIEEVRISPVSVKIKYKVIIEKGDSNNIGVNVYNEKGKILNGSGGGTSEGNITNMNYDYQLTGKESKIIIKPWVNIKSLNEEVIEINIPEK